jgi:hypothetical protein
MKKIPRSVNFEPDVYAAIETIARRSFSKNFSAAANWIIRALMKPEVVYEFMKRYHCGMMNHFKDLQENVIHTPDTKHVLNVSRSVQDELLEKNL